jgi:hypothetical protein
LDYALVDQGIQRVTTESRAADTTIQAVQNIVPPAVGDEFRNSARPHASPVGVPALVPAVDGDLTLGTLVVRVGFGGTVTLAEILKEHGDRVKARRGAPVITSFVTVERSTFSGSAILFSLDMGSPWPVIGYS